MFAEQPGQEPQKESSSNDQFPLDILVHSYRMMEDRLRLVAIEEILRAAKKVSNNRQTFSEVEKQLLGVKISDEARGLIPEIFKELRTVVSQGGSELRPERPLRDVFGKISQQYEKELLKIYHNEEHDFDTRRIDVLHLLVDLEDYEQDSCAFVERRKLIWPTIVKNRLRELIASKPNIANQLDIEEIMDEVLGDLHKRLLEFIDGTEKINNPESDT